jgi:hypothetical protein
MEPQSRVWYELLILCIVNIIGGYVKSKAETLSLFVLSDQITRIIKESIAVTHRLYIEFLGF